MGRRGWGAGRGARAGVAGATLLATAALGAGLWVPAGAEPIGDPIEIEIDSPGPGLPDPLDPPLLALPDPDLATLPVRAEHPWMLFSEDELPALRARILSADPSSVVGQMWTRFLAGLADPRFADRDGYEAGLRDPTDRRWGRDDLLSAAFAHEITQDPEHLELARRLLRYAVTLTPDYGAPIEPGVDEYYIQRAHRLNGFALAYDLLHDDLDPVELAQLRAIVEVLAEQHFVHANTAWWGTLSSGSNIGSNNAAALGTAGLALWHDNPMARTWVVRSEQIVRGYFHEGFDPLGAGIEGVLYGNYGMRIPTYLGHALTRAGHPHLFDAGGIPGHQPAYAYDVLPSGGAVNPVNDARYYEINPTYTTWQIANGPNPDLSAWLFDNMTLKVPGTGRNLGETIPTLLWYAPSDPAYDPAEDLPLAAAFRRRGYVVTRSGWRPDDLMASFEVRQTDWGEGVHQNQDVTQFTLYDEGAKLIVDSRYGNYLSKLAAGDFDALATSESEGHNVVVADGRTQSFFGKGRLTGFASLAVVGEPGPADIAAADARLAWLEDQPQQADRFLLHTRTGVDAAGAATLDYLVTADRFVQGGDRHHYTSFLHTDWRSTVHADPEDPGRVTIASGEVPGVSLHIDAHVQDGHERVIDTFTPDDAQDWARIGENGRRTHARIRWERSGAAYRAITVMVPTGAGDAAPVVRRTAAAGGIATVVEIGTGVTDTLLLADDSSITVAAEGVETDADFLSVRRSAAGVEHLAMTGGTFVDVDGERVLTAAGGPATVVATGDAVSASGATPAPSQVVSLPSAMVAPRTALPISSPAIATAGVASRRPDRAATAVAGLLAAGVAAGATARWGRRTSRS